MFKLTKKLRAIFAIVLIFVLIYSMGGLVYGESIAPSASEKAVIEKAAKMLEDMGDTSMATNIRTWLTGNKIKIDSDLPDGTNGKTNKKV